MASGFQFKLGCFHAMLWDSGSYLTILFGLAFCNCSASQREENHLMRMWEPRFPAQLPVAPALRAPVAAGQGWGSLPVCLGWGAQCCQGLPAWSFLIPPQLLIIVSWRWENRFCPSHCIGRNGATIFSAVFGMNKAVVYNFSDLLSCSFPGLLPRENRLPIGVSLCLSPGTCPGRRLL